VRPAAGAQGTVVRVDHARFLPDGRANIVGVGVRTICLQSAWVEDGTGGLWYGRASTEDGDGVEALAQAGSRGGAAGVAMRESAAPSSGQCACLVM
jgi:hypothetical protein